MKSRFVRKLVVTFCDALLVSSVLFLPRLAVLFAAFVPPCIFFEMGYLCPSCGGTSCVYNMAKGNFALAFGHNPMIFLTIIALIALAVLVNIEIIFEFAAARVLRRKICTGKTIIIWAVCFLGFTILRNLL